jgi:hypothetical protein
MKLGHSEMLGITISSTANDVIRKLEKQQKQVRFATALALTKTAQIAKRDVEAEMQRKFDRPTPYTMKSVFTKRATPAVLEASAFIKDINIGGGQGLSTAELLQHQFIGGKRAEKRSEWRFIQAGLMSIGEFLVPGKGAKLDRYGNMSRGQMQQVMSQVRVGVDPYQYSTNSRRSKRNQSKAGKYFWSHGDHLPRGVWLRVGLRGVIPVLLVVKTPKYTKRIDLEKIRQKVITRDFPREFDKALDFALRTAR